MITECIGVYGEDRKFVQVSAVILDDSGESLHEHIKNASVHLMFNDTAILTKRLEPLDYNEGERAFYVFFLNPPVERNIFIRLDVETFEGQKSTVKKPVALSTVLPYQDVATNPMLSGRPVLDFTNSTKGLNGETTPL